MLETAAVVHFPQSLQECNSRDAKKLSVANHQNFQILLNSEKKVSSNFPKKIFYMF